MMNRLFSTMHSCCVPLSLLLLLVVETTGFGFHPSSSSSSPFSTVVVRSEALCHAETRLYVSMGGSLEEDFAVRRNCDSGTLVASAAALPPLQKKELLQPTQSQTRSSSSSDISASEYAWSAKVAKRVFATTTIDDNASPVLLFDGVCNLCNEAVLLCLDWDDGHVFRFASLQSQVGRALLIQTGRDPDDRSTMVLVRRKAATLSTASFELSCHTGSDAVLLLAAELQGLPRMLRWSAKVSMALVPAFLRESVMKVVSANRHLLGQSDGPQCRLDLDGIYESRFLEDIDPPLLQE